MEEETRPGTIERGKEKIDSKGRLGKRNQDSERKSREIEREDEGGNARERKVALWK